MTKHTERHFASTPHRPACWVVAPELMPSSDPAINKFQGMERKALAEGIKLRLVIFDEKPEPLMGLIGYAADQNGPREEQLQRIYASIKAGPPSELISAMEV